MLIRKLNGSRRFETQIGIKPRFTFSVGISSIFYLTNEIMDGVEKSNIVLTEDA